MESPTREKYHQQVPEWAIKDVEKITSDLKLVCFRIGGDEVHMECIKEERIYYYILTKWGKSWQMTH